MTIQDSVPIEAVHEKEGIIETYPGFFTKSYLLLENNYGSETEEVQRSLLKRYREVLNAVGVSAEIAVTIHNREIDEEEFKERVLLKETGDELDWLRRERNEITFDEMKEGLNGITKKKYLTIGVHAESLRKAEAEFHRLGSDLAAKFSSLGSGAAPIPIEERLEILHDIYKSSQAGMLLQRVREVRKDGRIEEKTFFDFENVRAQGAMISDIIGPESMQIYPAYLMLGNRYARVMEIKHLPSRLSDEFFVRLTDVDFTMLSTVNIRPVQPKEASALVHKSLVLAQTARSDEVKGLLKAGLSEDMVSPESNERVERALSLRSDMVNEDEKLFLTTYTVIFFAKSLEELKERTKVLQEKCQEASVGIRIMEGMQEEGFNTTLPLLSVEIPLDRRRTLKSSSIAAVSMPFSNLELSDPDGIHYSQNLRSRNLILYNRLLTLNFNGFILGTPGSGKSLSAKNEILNVFLGTNADCIVIDPEEEYLPLAKILGGEVIKIEPGGKWHINPMEISSFYEWTREDDSTESNPVLAKADFILQLMGVLVKTNGGLTSIQETIIDECVRELYQPFIGKDGRLKRIPPKSMPTLTDLQKAFERREEEEAYELSMALKLYTGNGSLNVFGFQSNVDIKSPFIVYDIKDVGEKLKPISMLIILDSIMHRLFENRRAGRHTWFWIDEIYLLFLEKNTAVFLNILWKRARKYGGVPTGLTQNVQDLLESDTARKMLSNSNFVEILNQEQKDREALANLLNLSKVQQDIVTSAPAGQGLIYTGKSCVPFSSTFPKTKKDGSINPIYRVLTSNMNEIRQFEEEEARRRADKAMKENKVVSMTGDEKKEGAA